MNDNSDKHIDPAGSVTFRARDLWFGETGYPENHPTQMVADIAVAFVEATSDMQIVLDNLAAVNLELANEDWRNGLGTTLERDLDHLTTLVRNAVGIARNPITEGDGR